MALGVLSVGEPDEHLLPLGRDATNYRQEKEETTLHDVTRMYTADEWNAPKSIRLSGWPGDVSHPTSGTTWEQSVKYFFYHDRLYPLIVTLVRRGNNDSLYSIVSKAANLNWVNNFATRFDYRSLLYFAVSVEARIPPKALRVLAEWNP